MDNEMRDMFNLILEEINGVEERADRRFISLGDSMNRRFDRIESRLESMQHEINACRLDNESVCILIKKIEQLEKRIEELEKRIA